MYKALISGMTDFAHLNDYILLANFKSQNLLHRKDTGGFDRSFVDKITVLSSNSFCKLGRKITISQFAGEFGQLGTTVA